MYANAIGNLIYVVAGCIIDQSAFGDGNCPVITNVLEIYNPVANSWSTGPAASVVWKLHYPFNITETIQTFYSSCRYTTLGNIWKRRK
jgi:hypothetical protein